MMQSHLILTVILLETGTKILLRIKDSNAPKATDLSRIKISR